MSLSYKLYVSILLNTQKRKRPSELGQKEERYNFNLSEKLTNLIYLVFITD